MQKQDFIITRDNIPHGVKFTVKGRVSAANADEFQFKLENALKGGEANIVLNMLQVDFLSSTGIRIILKTYKDAVKAGVKFGIEQPSENVRNVLGMVALDEMLIQ